MLQTVLKLVFIIGFTLIGTLLVVFLRSLFPSSGMGFDGIANFLGWMMGGAALAFIISLYLVRQLNESQIKAGALILSLLTVICIGLFYYKMNKEQKELPPQERPITKPISPETDQ